MANIYVDIDLSEFTDQELIDECESRDLKTSEDSSVAALCDFIVDNYSAKDIPQELRNLIEDYSGRIMQFY